MLYRGLARSFRACVVVHLPGWHGVPLATRRIDLIDPYRPM